MMVLSLGTLFLLAIVGAFVVLYAIPSPASTQNNGQDLSPADARLARWIEHLAPLHEASPLSDVSALPPVQRPFRSPRHLEKNQVLIPIDPFPLGHPSARDNDLYRGATAPAELASVAKTFDFVEARFSFQDNVLVHPPRIDLARYKHLRPHNFNDVGSRPTFATLLCTRDSSAQDPYFAATLNLVFRLLWSPEVASKKYPFTVFVAPFVSQRQRDILAGAGAFVKELDLVPWKPNVEGVWARWRDQFSKLHMWSHTEYSKIAFMDADAFPTANIDDILEMNHQQTCVASELPKQDADVEREICNYTFAGVDVGSQGYPNGGFLVLQPNARMHERLMRNYIKSDEYDNAAVEQAFLGKQFSSSGPFPMVQLSRRYNGLFPQPQDEGKLSIVHEKLWTGSSDLPGWLRNAWKSSWVEMSEFFGSQQFEEARKRDGELATSSTVDDRARSATDTATSGSNDLAKQAIPLNPGGNPQKPIGAAEKNSLDRNLKQKLAEAYEAGLRAARDDYARHRPSEKRHSEPRVHAPGEPDEETEMQAAQRVRQRQLRRHREHDYG